MSHQHLRDLLRDIPDVRFGIASTGRSESSAEPASAVVLVPTQADTAALRRLLKAIIGAAVEPSGIGHLFLVANDAQRGAAPAISAVTYFGLLDREALEDWGIAVRTGRPGLCFSAASDRELQRDLDIALDALTLGERPVRVARIHCIVPVQYGRVDETFEASEVAYRALRHALIEVAEQRDTSLTAESSDDGRHYFLPHVQPLAGAASPLPVAGDVAYDEKLDERIVTIAWTAPATLAVAVNRKNRADTLFAPLESLRLHLYTERTIALEFTLAWHAPGDSAGLKSGDALWSDLVLAGEEAHIRSAAAWLDLTEAARFVFSAFTFDASESARGWDVTLVADGIALAELKAGNAGLPHSQSSRLPFGPIVSSLLKRFLTPVAATLPDGKEPEDLRDLFELRCDDRARVVQALVLSGAPPSRGPAEARLAPFEERLALLDSYGVEHFYAPDFVTNAMSSAAYDRFRHLGSRYFVTCDALSYLGFGGFAEETIAAHHVPTLYRRMALMIHLNGAVISGLLRDLAATLGGWKTGEADLVHAPERVARIGLLQRRYLKFLSLNWFDQVSSQMQGIELYDLMRKSSLAQRERLVVDEEITRTSEFLVEQRERVAAERERATVERERATVEREREKQEHDRFLVALLAVATLLYALPSIMAGSAWITVARIVSTLLPFLPHQTGHLASESWASELSGAVAIAIVAFLIDSGVLQPPPEVRRPGGRWRFWLPVTLSIVLPFLPLVPGVSQPASSLGCVIYIAASIGLTVWAAHTLNPAGMGASETSSAMRRLYWTALGSFMLLTLLRTTGLINS